LKKSKNKQIIKNRESTKETKDNAKLRSLYSGKMALLTDILYDDD
jgi:hypothetical protein